VTIILVFALVLVVGLTLYCIIDAVKRTSDTFRAADSNKTLWIVLLFVFHFFASIVYLVAVRPKLKVAHQ
jgi:hypothetical protein